MPHVKSFAEHALVYHNHTSAGTFTVPGTASILTGLYPWTHRALQLYGTIIRAQYESPFFKKVTQTFGTRN